MSERITGEQLEAASYDKPNLIDNCSLCGARFNVDDDSYAESIDGKERFCADCMKDKAKLSVIKSKKGYFCAASYEDEEFVTKCSKLEKRVLERAAKVAKRIWLVESCIERN